MSSLCFSHIIFPLCDYLAHFSPFGVGSSCEAAASDVSAARPAACVADYLS